MGLIIRNVSKSYGKLNVLENINLNFNAGEMITFLGPSGCGKTTLLRIVAGLEEPSSGSIVLDDTDITQVPIHKRDIGMVFQSFALFPHLSVGQNISYGMKIRGATREELEHRVRELLDLIRLPGIENRRIDQLSGGQRQRVAIARALALRPKLFLLDEPMSALDANMREEMQIELRRLQQKLGITTIVVTHDQTEAMTISDRIVVMNQKTVQQFGQPIDIYKNPVNRSVADFIGASNLVPVRITGQLEASFANSRIEFSKSLQKCKVGDVALLLTRPEDVIVEPKAKELAANALEGKVSFIRDIGMLVEILVECGGHTFIAVMTPQHAPEVKIGDQVRIRLPAPACTILEA